MNQTKQLKRWMVKQRFKMCIAGAVFEILKEVEKKRNPQFHHHIIEIAGINKDSIEIRQLDSGQVFTLGVGQQYIFVERR